MRKSKSPGQVRIIAGQWRGRKLPVPTVEGLRPTGDRVRETLFNWLQPYVVGSHCLDLFAGSGALGFEARSRYAASLTLVEPAPAAAAQLLASARLLGDDSVRLERTTAERFLQADQRRFDIVFVDPPFAQAIQWDMLSLLAPEHLNAQAWVYVEAPTRQERPDSWPPGYSLQREKRFGDVKGWLLRFESPPVGTA